MTEATLQPLILSRLAAPPPPPPFPTVQLEFRVFEEVFSAIYSGTMFGLPVQLPNFCDVAFGTRRAMSNLLRQLADAMDVGDSEVAKEIAKLRQFDTDWDGAGAPSPSAQVIQRTEMVLNWAVENGLRIFDVDADVLGGAAVWLEGRTAGRRVWISYMNNGHDSIVLLADSSVVHHETIPLNEGTGQLGRLLVFLSETTDDKTG